MRTHLILYNSPMSKKKTKRMGRPPVDNPATEQLPTVRVTKDQLKHYKEAADLERQPFSQWVRSVLDKAANRIKAVKK